MIARLGKNYNLLTSRLKVVDGAARNHGSLRRAQDSYRYIPLYLGCDHATCPYNGAASVATFPRHATAKYGTSAGEPFTAVSRSQAVRGWDITSH